MKEGIFQMIKIDAAYREYQTPLVAYSCSIVGNVEDAHDVVQEVFSECIKMNIILQIDEAKSYLYRAVRNRSNNKLRGRTRFYHLLNNFAEWLFPEMEEEENEILGLVMKLPPKMKEIIILRIKDELSIAEIADILDIPAGTVKSRINSAIKMLKKFAKD